MPEIRPDDQYVDMIEAFVILLAHFLYPLLTLRAHIPPRPPKLMLDTAPASDIVSIKSETGIGGCDRG